MTNCLPLWGDEATREAAKDDLRRRAERIDRERPVKWDEVFGDTPEASGTARKAPSGRL
jgi:hypothetical protein